MIDDESTAAQIDRDAQALLSWIAARNAISASSGELAFLKSLRLDMLIIDLPESCLEWV